jgi:tetraacyldisaccharide 4'-kinase
MRLSIESFLHRQWQQRGWWSWLMCPLSALYGCLSGRAKQQALRRQQRIPVPVVVAGNVFVGGTGKTPLVIAIVQHLQAQGLRPV